MKNCPHCKKEIEIELKKPIVKKEEIEIIDLKLDFNFENMTKRSLNNIEFILVHHTGTINSALVNSIHNNHKNKWDSGIGYHYLIADSGEIFKGRPDEYSGANCPDENGNSKGVAISFIGNFEEKEMSNAQEIAGLKLIHFLKKKYKLDKVYNHKDLSIEPTICPGKNCPVFV